MKNYIITLFLGVYFGIFSYLKDYNDYYKTLSNIKYFNNAISILNGFLAIILTYFIINILEKNIGKIITKMANKNSNNYTKFLFDLIFKFINISKYIIAVYIGCNIMIIPEKISLFIDKGFYVSFIITFIILLNTFINSIFKELQKNEDKHSMSKHIFPIINKIIIIFIWVVGIITILSNLGYNVGALITGAGVGGLAIALAAQKTVANIFGAINVLVNKPFKIGDHVKIGNFEGTVEDIGLIYLKLRNTNGHQILMPNETIISAAIENYSNKK